MTEREILEKKLKELKRLEAKEFQKKHYPEMAKFIGKCYCCVDKQYKSVNSTYFKIVDIKPGDVYCGGPDNNTPLARCTCLFFSVTAYFDGRFSWHVSSKEDCQYVHSVTCYAEIKPDLFDKRFNQMIENIAAANKKEKEEVCDKWEEDI